MVLKKYCLHMKKKVSFYLLAALLLTIGIYLILPQFAARTDLLSKREAGNEFSDNTYILTKNAPIVRQTFRTNLTSIKSVEVKFGTNAKVNHGKIRLELWDETLNKKLGEVEKPTELIRDNEPERISFKQSILVNNMNEHSILIEAEADEITDEISIHFSNDDVYENGCIYTSDLAVHGDLLFSLYGSGERCLAGPVFFLTALGILVLISMMCYLIVSGKMNQHFDKVEKADFFFVMSALLLFWLCFNQGGDMKSITKTAGELLSITKHGGFFDFYSILLERSLHGWYETDSIMNAGNYNIFLYLIPAVCIFPCFVFSKITGIQYSDNFIILWMGLFIAAAVLYSAYLLYHLVLDMGMKLHRAKITAYLYLSSIMLLFATVGFCQLDIFCTILVIAALRRYVNKQYIKFSLIISIAIMLKSFPVLMFLPLILAVEKRLIHIIKYFALGFSAPVVFKIVFGLDGSYQIIMDEFERVYGFYGRLFSNGLSTGAGNCAFLVFIIVCLCVWAFHGEYREEEIWKYIITIPLTAYISLLIFVGWHPQWLTILAPFLAIALGCFTSRGLIYCEWGLGVLYCLAAGNNFPQNVDNYMVNYGILPVITKYYYSGVTFQNVFQNIDYFSNIVASALTAVAVSFCCITWKNRKQVKSIDEFDDVYLQRSVVWMRIASMYVYCMILLIFYFYAG